MVTNNADIHAAWQHQQCFATVAADLRSEDCADDSACSMALARDRVKTPVWTCTVGRGPGTRVALDLAGRTRDKVKAPEVPS